MAILLLSLCGGCGSSGGSGVTPKYKDNGNGTITDSAGLMWQKQDDAVARTWDAATTYCSGLGLAGLSGWRLPALTELQSLIVMTSLPRIDATYFPSTQQNYYWSSTTHETLTTRAWLVSFQTGASDHFDKTNSFFVRCVR